VLGQVTDSTNAPIPGAILRITRVENNETRIEISDVTGNYGCAFLTPGTYRIQVHAKGFKTLERTNLQLDTDDTLVLPLILQVGELADHVTVGAQRESLDMTSASHVTRRIRRTGGAAADRPTGVLAGEPEPGVIFHAGTIRRFGFRRIARLGFERQVHHQWRQGRNQPVPAARRAGESLPGNGSFHRT
jgi:hypothetical protein